MEEAEEMEKVLTALARCACESGEAVQAALARHAAAVSDPRYIVALPDIKPGDVLALTPPSFL